MRSKAKIENLIRHNEVALAALRRAAGDRFQGVDLFPPDAEEILGETAAWLWAVVDNVGALDDMELRLTRSEAAVRRYVRETQDRKEGAADAV